MANIKFSQFTEKTTLGTVDFLVGYTGAENVQISPTNLLSTFVSGSGTNGQVAYFDPSNNLAGENDFFWDYTNNRLGIKTTSPEARIHVRSNDNQTGRLLLVDQDGGGDATLSLRLSGTIEYAIGIDNSDSDSFKISNGNAVGSTDYLTITSSGNVGIGTTSPGSKLQVNGTFANTGIAQIGSTGANVYLTSSSAGSVGIGTSSPTDKLDIAGAVRFTSNITFDSGKAGRIYKASNHGLAIQGVTGTENDLALFSPTGSLRIVVPTGTNNLVLNRDTGNVGIGATSSNTFGGASKLFVDIGTGQGSIRLQNGNTDGVYFRRHTSGGSYQLQTYSSTSNTGVLSLQPFGGNVGIGTTSPSFKLEVSGGGIKSPFFTTDGGRSFKMDSVAFVGGYSNGSDANGANDLGSTTNQWRDIYISGDITSSAGGATFAGSINTTGKVNIGLPTEGNYFEGGSGGVRKLTITTGTNTSPHALHTFNIASSNGKYKFDVNGTEQFSIDSSSATFAGDITVSTASATLNLLSETNGNSTINFADPADNNVGQIIYRHNGNSMAFDTNDVERMRISSNGNVAIGTTSSAYRLQVEESTTGLLSRFHNTNANGQGLLIRAGSTSSATRIIQLASENDTKVMTVNSNGRVGIGSTNPTSKLTVAVGDIETSGVGYGIILKSPDGTRYRVTVDNSGNLVRTAI